MNDELIEVEIEKVELNDNNSAEPNTNGDTQQDRVKRIHMARRNRGGIKNRRRI